MKLEGVKLGPAAQADPPTQGCSLLCTRHAINPQLDGDRCSAGIWASPMGAPALLVVSPNEFSGALGLNLKNQAGTAGSSEQWRSQHLKELCKETRSELLVRLISSCHSERQGLEMGVWWCLYLF